MSEEAVALREQQAELARLLDGCEETDWARAAPRCPGWSVADVVLHLAQTNELAIASVEGRLPEAAEGMGSPGREDSVDEAADLMVAAQRDVSVPELRDRWQTGVDTLQRALEVSDPHRRVMWVAGELSIRTLTTTRLAETWIHTGDVGDALGVTLPPSDRQRHIARLAWRTLPYAFARAGRELQGPVAFELTGPSGEAWSFTPAANPVTVIRGDGHELCLVAARRAEPAETGLRGEGPDAEAVLELVRTYAL